MEQTKRYFNLDDYVGVPERIEAFWKDYPNGSIVTEVLENTSDHSLIKASVRKDKTTSYIDSTGHAEEPKNKEKQLNKCETVAVGRALALIGYEVKKGIASKEEMEGFTDEPIGKGAPKKVGVNIQEKFGAKREEPNIPNEDKVPQERVAEIEGLLEKIGERGIKMMEAVLKGSNAKTLNDLGEAQAIGLRTSLKKMQ